ncbi:type IX secretion system membrane protein PorP/SprF [Aquimarina sp. W85]|uniref:PorP/SprF family type IX secretion system membrane protein n=1 Tax=Aquimarina rhodophyticola TaxID=3342246 RepID=UPI00366C6EA8
MKRKLPRLFLLFLLICDLSYGQQDTQYTQYMYNAVSFNSAYTGSRGVLSITGLHRSQWLGIDGAPNTQSLSIHTPISQNNKIGVGLSIINDNAGAFRETNFNASFSYTINTSVINNSRLAFGISAGGNLLNVDLLSLEKFNENDFLLEKNIDNKFSPNLGVGIYYHTDSYYLGLSAPNILQTSHFNTNSLDSNSDNISVLAKERINYYLIAGYIIDLTHLIKLKPAILSKYIAGSPFQVDISANFLFYEKLTLGAAYRSSNTYSVIAGFEVSEGLMLGFAYDQGISKLGTSQINSGSYEILLRYELKNIYDKWLSPRFF